MKDAEHGLSARGFDAGRFASMLRMKAAGSDMFRCREIHCTVGREPSNIYKVLYYLSSDAAVQPAGLLLLGSNENRFCFGERRNSKR
jgi:hypothetical protein